MSNKLIKRTPCIGVCSTSYGDHICRGCKRFSHEVTGWIKYSDTEKSLVNERLQKFKTTILEDKFTIIDSEKLKNKLKDANISFNQELDPLCWVFDLFRTFTIEDIDLEEVGIALKGEFLNMSLSKIKEDINKEFLNEIEKINKIIEKINKKLTLVEKVKKIQLIDENFSIENGLLTPTMKVKRKKVTEKYKNKLEKLY